MSDDGGSTEAQFDPNGVFGVTDEDFSQFVNDRKIRISCAECGYDRTFLASQRSGKIPVILSTDLPPDLSSAIANYYFEMVCMNCGNIRLFERGIVAQWKLHGGKNGR